MATTRIPVRTLPDIFYDEVVTERAARLVAEARADTAEARASEERRARLVSEAHARAFQDELERLRRQQSRQ